MKFVATIFFVCFVANSQISSHSTDQRRIVLTGDASGNAGLDSPIEFQILQVPIQISGGAAAKGHGQALIGRNSQERAIILNGDVFGSAGLDHPIEIALLGVPISVNGGAEAKAHGAAQIGRSIYLSGNAAGSAGLDNPINLEILGLPISLSGGATGKGHGSAHIGRNIARNSGRGIVLTGDVSGDASLDEPITWEILGLPISLNGGGSAKGHGLAHIG